MYILYHYPSWLNFLLSTFQMLWTLSSHSETTLWVISFILKTTSYRLMHSIFMTQHLSVWQISKTQQVQYEIDPLFRMELNLGTFFLNKLINYLHNFLIFPCLEIGSLPSLHCGSLTPLLFN